MSGNHNNTEKEELELHNRIMQVLRKEIDRLEAVRNKLRAKSEFGKLEKQISELDEQSTKIEQNSEYAGIVKNHEGNNKQETKVSSGQAPQTQRPNMANIFGGGGVNLKKVTPNNDAAAGQKDPEQMTLQEKMAMLGKAQEKKGVKNTAGAKVNFSKQTSADRAQNREKLKKKITDLMAEVDILEDIAYVRSQTANPSSTLATSKQTLDKQQAEVNDLYAQLEKAAAGEKLLAKQQANEPEALPPVTAQRPNLFAGGNNPFAAKATKITVNPVSGLKKAAIDENEVVKTNTLEEKVYLQKVKNTLTEADSVTKNMPVLEADADFLKRVRLTRVYFQNDLDTLKQEWFNLKQHEYALAEIFVTSMKMILADSNGELNVNKALQSITRVKYNDLKNLLVAYSQSLNRLEAERMKLASREMDLVSRELAAHEKMKQEQELEKLGIVFAEPSAADKALAKKAYEQDIENKVGTVKSKLEKAGKTLEIVALEQKKKLAGKIVRQENITNNEQNDVLDEVLDLFDKGEKPPASQKEVQKALERAAKEAAEMSYKSAKRSETMEKLVEIVKQNAARAKQAMQKSSHNKPSGGNGAVKKEDDKQSTLHRTVSARRNSITPSSQQERSPGPRLYGMLKEVLPLLKSAFDQVIATTQPAKVKKLRALQAQLDTALSANTEKNLPDIRNTLVAIKNVIPTSEENSKHHKNSNDKSHSSYSLLRSIIDKIIVLIDKCLEVAKHNIAHPPKSNSSGKPPRRSRT